MAKEGNSNQGGRIALIAGIALAMPVLYVLSVGPAIAICIAIFGEHPPDWVQRVLQTVYYPVVLLLNNSELFEEYFVKYLEFWGGP